MGFRLRRDFGRVPKRRIYLKVPRTHPLFRKVSLHFSGQGIKVKQIKNGLYISIESVANHEALNNLAEKRKVETGQPIVWGLKRELTNLEKEFPEYRFDIKEIFGVPAKDKNESKRQIQTLVAMKKSVSAQLLAAASLAPQRRGYLIRIRKKNN